MIQLKNKSRTYKLYTLPPGVDDQRFVRSEQVVGPTGVAGVLETVRVLPGSLTLQAGETSRPLPETVVQGAVKSDLDRGVLVLVDSPPAVVAEPAPMQGQVSQTQRRHK